MVEVLYPVMEVEEAIQLEEERAEAATCQPEAEVAEEGQLPGVAVAAWAH